MSANGQQHDDAVLHWQGRLLTTADLRDRLNGAREVVVSPRAIVTPLVVDELRARGIRLVRANGESERPSPSASEGQSSSLAGAQARTGQHHPHVGAIGVWGYAQERRDPMVNGVIQATQRDGVTLRELSLPSMGGVCQWARGLAECVANGECLGGIVFCQDPGLVSCVSNKVDGVRAAQVGSVAQAARAMLTLGANLVAIETLGRTFFELRQIVRTLCVPTPSCPDQVACTLKELEHAHR